MFEPTFDTNQCASIPCVVLFPLAPFDLCFTPFIHDIVSFDIAELYQSRSLKKKSTTFSPFSPTVFDNSPHTSSFYWMANI